MVEKHVAVLAFPFGSHALTTFNLMVKLATSSPNMHFSFFSTKESNHTLFSSTVDLPLNIKLYDLRDTTTTTTDHDPLENFLTTTPQNYINGLQTAETETGRNITCLISDAFLTFAAEIADDLNIAWIPAFVAMPYNVSAHLHSRQIREFLINRKQIDPDPTLEIIPGLSTFRASDLPDELINNNDSSLFSSMLNKIEEVLPKASLIVMNFYRELYSAELLHDLESKFSNILNVGFLTPKRADTDPMGCISWLDQQKPKSVIYIGLGTVAKLSKQEKLDLAAAVEETGLSYLWSSGEPLPEDFVDRTRKRGKIVNRAPQGMVLGHEAVGAFVTHCGANSVMESVANGVPMICRPYFGDHMMNGRVVEEVWGVGVSVEGGVFSKSGVLKCLEIVFGCERIGENVNLMKEIVMDARSGEVDFGVLVEKVSGF